MKSRLMTEMMVVGLLTLSALALGLCGAGCGGSGPAVGPDTASLAEPDDLAADAMLDVPGPDDDATETDLATTTPTLTLRLAAELDTSAGTVKVTSITHAELLNTARTVVKTARIRNGAARFPLTGLTAGHYFIRVNGLASDLVPTRISNPAASLRQYVGRKLRSSVIGRLTSPKYRFETFSLGQGFPRVVRYSNGAGATPRGYAYVLMRPGTQILQVRYLGTAKLLTSHKHSGPHSFVTWMLGPSNHGTSSMSCSSCHGNLSSHPASYSSIKKDNGWCFKCHYGPGGPSNGMVKPSQ